MTQVNQQASARVVTYAAGCPPSGLGLSAIAVFRYNAPASVVSGRYTLQAGFTLKGSDGRTYWLQGIVAIDSVGDDYFPAGMGLNVEIRGSPPIVGHEPEYAANWGFTSVMPGQGDDFAITLDLAKGFLYGSLMHAGAMMGYQYVLPAPLKGGNIFYIESLPTGWFKEVATFNPPSDFFVYNITKVKAAWKAVPIKQIAGQDYSPCPSSCTLSNLTSEDCTLTYDIPPPIAGGDLNLTWEMAVQSTPGATLS